MPIRFKCSDCGQKLSVGSKKAGSKVKCPKCAQIVHVPSPSGAQSKESSSQQSQPAKQPQTSGVPGASEPVAASVAPAVPSIPHDEEQHSDDHYNDHESFSDFNVYDHDAEWVYEEDDEYEDAYDDYESEDAVDTVPVDPEKLAVSRQIIYMQGGLLGVVALTCFVLGLLIGWGSSGDRNAPIPAVPCVVQGNVTFSQNESPDEGAVVIFLPQNAAPDQGRKLPTEAFAPSSDSPAGQEAAYNNLRAFGGAHARVDGQGNFAVHLPDRGRYYVLVVSHNSNRRDDQTVLENDMREMSQYFAAAFDLVGQHQYRWSRESVNDDRRIDYLF